MMMNKVKIVLYGSICIAYFVVLHLIFPSTWPSITKDALDDFFSNPLGYWWVIFPMIPLAMLFGLIIYYGIHFLASFGSGFKAKDPYTPKITIMIATKNEKALLERTLNSIIKSEYPKENIQLIIVTSGSTDDSNNYCQTFAQENEIKDIEILSDDLPKKGKPPALNHGLKHVKNDILILYDSGCILQQNTLRNLVAPLKNDKIKVVLGPVLVKNWKTNSLTKGIFLDYGVVSGGGLLAEVKNRLGSSAYLYGRNFAIRKETLDKYGGFNEDSMTEDLYLSVLLNLDGIPIYYSPKAKVYEYVPSTWDILKQQRTRWLAGYTFDAPQLMKMKNEERDGAKIIIARNMTMSFMGNMDSWMPIIIVVSIIYFLTGEFYLLCWNLSLLFFQFGYLFNIIRKYADKHYSLLLFFPLSGYIHLYMFFRQFALPKDLSWEKTPMLLERQEEEVKALSNQ